MSTVENKVQVQIEKMVLELIQKLIDNQPLFIEIPQRRITNLEGEESRKKSHFRNFNSIRKFSNILVPYN
jgi:DNA topoisomerase VI subunit A